MDIPDQKKDLWEIYWESEETRQRISRILRDMVTTDKLNFRSLPPKKKQVVMREVRAHLKEKEKERFLKIADELQL